MKRAVGTVTLIAVLCISIWSVSAQCNTDVKNPTSIARDFYAYYIKDHPEISKAIEKWKDCFDEKFSSELMEALKKTPENNNCLWLDYDPFIFAQVRAKSFTIGKTTIKDNTASVIVYLKYERNSKGYVTVQFARRGDTWKMTDFIDDEKHSVYKSLRLINRKK